MLPWPGNCAAIRLPPGCARHEAGPGVGRPESHPPVANEEVIELSTSLLSPIAGASRSVEFSIPRRSNVLREIVPASALMSEIRSLRERHPTHKVELGRSRSERFPASRRPFRS